MTPAAVKDGSPDHYRRRAVRVYMRRAGHNPDPIIGGESTTDRDNRVIGMPGGRSSPSMGTDNFVLIDSACGAAAAVFAICSVCTRLAMAASTRFPIRGDMGDMGRVHLSKRRIVRDAPAAVARGFIRRGTLATHIATSIPIPLVVTPFTVRGSPDTPAASPGVFLREMDVRNARRRTVEVITRGDMVDTNGNFPVGESRLGFLLGCCLFAELDRTALMPLIALCVRLIRECGCWEVDRKRRAGVGMFQGPVTNSELENRDMC